MPRFLHTADWQIGRLYASLPPENAMPLADARIACVERLAALAASESVDAVLVAGDVFDAQNVSERTVRRLFNAMAAWAGPWVLIPGNHDAALAESVWTRARRLGAVPDHVHLCLSPEPLLLPAIGLAVLPAPLTQRHTHNDLTDWFDAAETPEGLLRIGLAHGSVQGLLAEDIDSANPIAPDRAVRARLDYLALGDWHGCKRIDARTWYAGTPEPDRHKDNGAGQALVVDIAAPGELPQVSQRSVGRHRWRAIEAALAVPSDLDGLLAQLDTLGPDDVVDLRIGGALDLAAHGRLKDALSRAEARCRHLGVDLSGLRLSPTDADIAALKADGYLGELIMALRERQSRSDDAAAARTAADALAILSAELLDLGGAS
jgi:DNA repair exonuclease SbcCD nuclease subunit